jgi:NADH-quinone oxidoreductase subunit H
MIPLAPQIQIGERVLSFHVFGNTSAGLLYVLALEWISVGLLIVAERDTGSPRHNVALVGKSLLAILPTSCIVLSLILTAGTLHARQRGSLNLVTLVELQGEWRGLRWLGIFQPLSLLLWLICTAPLRSLVQTRATFARQVHALNRTLLASALFLGGWQGPFVGQRFWLGLAYTAIKVGGITFLWVWTWSSSPQPGMSMSTRTVWQILVPLAVINFLLTATVIVLL